MSVRKHTPSWQVVEDDEGFFNIHVSTGDDTLGDPVAAAYEEREALLIASAPDLLEAAKLALPSDVTLNNPHVPDDTIIPLDVTMGDLRKIAAAIAKATPSDTHEVG